MTPMAPAMREALPYAMRERTSTYLSTAHTTETGGNVNLALEAVNVKVLATDGERGRGSYRPALRMVMVVPWTMP